MTRDTSYQVEPGWRTAASPAEAIELLQQAGVERTLVVGGQTVNTAFARAGLLDEVMLFVESVLIGSGMPLFAATDMPDLKLRLVNLSRPTDTVLQLRYEVAR
jgi:dihydrofolate reductase